MENNNTIKMISEINSNDKINIIVASNNKNKIKEIKKILQDNIYSIYSLSDIGLDIDVVEDGNNYYENAYKKAKEVLDVVKKLGIRDDIYVLSDDSGLEVPYLDNGPGIYSARYSNTKGADKDLMNNLKLMEAMKGVEFENRTARYVCTLVLLSDMFDSQLILRSVYGHITENYSIEDSKDKDIFGYDPIFYYDKFKTTFDKIDDDKKLQISHRGQALRGLKTMLTINAKMVND